MTANVEGLAKWGQESTQATKKEVIANAVLEGYSRSAKSILESNELVITKKKKNMFNSIHSQRLLKWLSSPKKFIVDLKIKVGEKYTFRDVEVVAHFRSEAKQKAKQKVKDEIEIIVTGSKSLGKIKQFNEF